MCQNSIREVYWQEHGTHFESVFFQGMALKGRRREEDEGRRVVTGGGWKGNLLRNKGCLSGLLGL